MKSALRLGGATALLLFAALPLWSDTGATNTAGRVVGSAIDRSVGKRLFFSSAFSRDGNLACASCHVPENRFQDGYARSLARSSVALRNAPTLLNVGRYHVFFWDGRAPTLEDQIREPLTSPSELEANDDSLAEFLAQDPRSSLAYRDWARGQAAPTATDFAVLTLAQFVRSLGTANSRYERYLAGNATFTEQERRGRELFDKAGCSSCHRGMDLTDSSFHDIGLARSAMIVQSRIGSKHGSEYELTFDYGRGNVTSGLAGIGRFRTPSLYNVARTAPYMHDGSIPTLRAVLDFYSRGGDRSEAARVVRPLSETEKDELVAFLLTLDTALPELAPQ